MRNGGPTTRSVLQGSRVGAAYRMVVGVALLLVGLLGLVAGCTSASPASSSQPASGQHSGATIAVVASTNVWANIAEQVGGQRVSVTALVHDPSQDPHEFQPAGRDELAVSRASLIVENGGGYDDFMDHMRSAVAADTPVVDATDIAHAKQLSIGDNEHVWYDPDIVDAVAGAIADALEALDPGHANDYRANLARFDESSAALRSAIAGVRTDFAGTPVAATESVAGYLIRATGLIDRTPPEFSDAVEDGIDVTPRQLEQVLTLVEDHDVALVFDNTQSTTAQSSDVIKAAQQYDVPVIDVSELLPQGENYQQWMLATVNDIRSALDRKVVG